MAFSLLIYMFLFLALIFGLMLLLMGIIFLITSIIKNRNKTRKPKKGLKIVSIIFLIIGLLVSIIPATAIMVIRADNAKNFRDFVNTGVWAHYESYIEDEGYNTNSLILNNIRYIKIPYGGEKMKAVANIHTAGGSDLIFTTLFGFDEARTLYAMKNATGCDIIGILDTTPIIDSIDLNNYYCKESDLAKIKKYYNNLKDFDFYFSKINDSTIENGETFRKIPLTFQKFNELLNSKGKKQEITGKYEGIKIVAISHDKAYRREKSLMLHKKRLVVLLNEIDYQGENNFTYTGFPLPEKLSTYLMSLIEKK